MAYQVEDYLREDKLPHLWCAGCGHGITVRALAEAMAGLQLDPTQVVVTTGIGCYGKADDYMNTHCFHGTHGRALAFASGIKAVKPELKVLALMGDGDSSTIGGNHLIHAARRNIDMTAIVANNLNYGMTGGQLSATTPEGSRTTTSAYGTTEPDMDLCNLVTAAGAPFVARGTTYHVTQLQKVIQQAIQHKGFSFVEIATLCPTYFGRYNWNQTLLEKMHWLKEYGVSKAKYDKLSPEKQKEAFIIGKLVEKDQEDFNTKYQRVVEKAQNK